MWNTTSSTKPEVHKVLHSHQRRTEPWPHLTYTTTETSVKFGQCGFEIHEQTDRQTDRHADHNTMQPCWGHSKNSNVMYYGVSIEMWLLLTAECGKLSCPMRSACKSLCVIEWPLFETWSPVNSWWWSCWSCLITASKWRRIDRSWLKWRWTRSASCLELLTWSELFCLLSAAFRFIPTLTSMIHWWHEGLWKFLSCWIDPCHRRLNEHITHVRDFMDELRDLTGVLIQLMQLLAAFRLALLVCIV